MRSARSSENHGGLFTGCPRRTPKGPWNSVKHLAASPAVACCPMASLRRQGPPGSGRGHEPVTSLEASPAATHVAARLDRLSPRALASWRWTSRHRRAAQVRDGSAPLTGVSRGVRGLPSGLGMGGQGQSAASALKALAMTGSLGSGANGAGMKARFPAGLRSAAAVLRSRAGVWVAHAGLPSPGCAGWAASRRDGPGVRPEVGARDRAAG